MRAIKPSMNDARSALVLFSGGQDSTTCLAWALERFAHVETVAFASIRDRLLGGEQPLAAWRSLVTLPRLLFAEPSPAPIKHWLWRSGLIDSPEVRLPMTRVSDALAARIDRRTL